MFAFIYLKKTQWKGKPDRRSQSILLNKDKMLGGNKLEHRGTKLQSCCYFKPGYATLPKL